MSTIAPTPTTLTPGMILVGTWGYEQTNVDFYVVTRTTERTAWLRPVAQRIERLAGFMSEAVVPLPEQPIGPEVRRRVIAATSGPRVHTSMGHHATAWDGEPVRQSHYA